MALRFARSRSRPAVGSLSSRRRAGSQSGFSLIEVLISTGLLVFGLASVAQLLGVTIKAESMARHGAEATRLAQAQLDTLMKSNFDTDPRVQVQSPGATSLDGNETNYFATPAANTVVRWRVQAGPAGTRVLTVRVLVANGTTTMRIVDVGTLLRRW